jgi:hypothetical protein
MGGGGLLGGDSSDTSTAGGEVVQRLLRLVDGEVAPGDELLGVQLAHAAALLDRRVHDRLRVAGVVALVVAVAPVADHVDDDVLGEGLPECEGELHHAHARLRVVAVDMEDRCLDGLGHVGRVLARAALVRRGGEPELVVDDQVDGPADAVPAQLAHRHGLEDHAAAGERRVAVHQDGQHRKLVVAVVDLVQSRPRHADDHRIDGFEVAGVARQEHVDRVAVLGRVPSGGAHVVLDVAGTLHALGVEVTFELVEDLLVALVEDVGQHVEPPAVRHAHHGVVDAGVRRLGQQGVEHGDQRLGALQREALLAQELGVQELLERLGRVEAAQDVALLRDVERVGHALHTLLDPCLLLGLLDVHVLDAHRAAVGIAEHTEQLTERHGLLARDVAGQELAVEVPDGQAVGERVELGVQSLEVVLQRVEVGDQMPADAVHVDHLLHGDLLDADVTAAVAIDDARVLVGTPACRLVGDLQTGEDVVIEGVLAEQHLLDQGEEHPRLGALDHAVVVGGRHRDDLAHAQLGQRAWVGGLVFSGIPDGADADDHALSGHQPGHAADGADRAGIGQRGGRAREQLR